MVGVEGQKGKWGGGWWWGGSIPLVNESCVRGGASFYLSSLLKGGPAQTAGPPSFLPHSPPALMSHIDSTVFLSILHNTDFIYFFFLAVKKKA